MSQDYFAGSGASSSAGEGSSRRRQQDPSDDPTFPRPPPAYMTVGNGSTSENATALMASLNDDSGYGGSIAGDSAANGESQWRSGLMQDRPTPRHTPTLPGEWNPAAEHERQIVASHVHQLMYNSNRTKLARAISRTVETLKELQEMNSQWPAHYPSVQNNFIAVSDQPELQSSQTDVGRDPPRRPELGSRTA